MEKKSTYEKPGIKKIGTIKTITKGPGDGDGDLNGAGSV